jgi:hypothetical protein
MEVADDGLEHRLRRLLPGGDNTLGTPFPPDLNLREGTLRVDAHHAPGIAFVMPATVSRKTAALAKLPGSIGEMLAKLACIGVLGTAH